MASYTLTLTATRANVTIANSTKVKVVANNACFYAIDAAASATANVGPMIAANRPTDVILGGLDKIFSIVPAAGSSTAITVTEVGAVSSTALQNP